jgi:hypothetical protein
MLCVFASVGAFAAQISGTVTNGTTNKPSSGDEVVLLSLASGMDEVARTRTDIHGQYTLNVPDDGAPHLVRVSRQSVQYFKSVPPGSATVDVTVYDAATQLDIVSDARVFHFQAGGGNLEVSDMYVLNNQSQPPRSRIGNQTFAVTLPDGAEMSEASVTGPSGMPLAVTPVPSGVKNRYAFDFPIRPGQTRFEIFYKLPYSGKYDFLITPETALNELGVLLPKTMKFTGISAGFAQDSDEAGLAVFFAKNIVANQQIKFSITGEGTIPRDVPAAIDSQPTGTAGAPATASSSAGTQTGAFWYIIGLMVALIGGGAFVLWRKTAPERAGGGSGGTGPARGVRSQRTQSANPAPEDMLEVLKNELFQLETDRLQGKISQDEYEKAKAGLDMLFRRQSKKR